MSGDRLRIALLSYRGNPRSGGQGVYVRQLSRELRTLGHDVEVIAGPPYPVLADGVRLTRLRGLDLFAEPNPFRTPALRELRGIPDWVEFAGMRLGGFPEPLAFSLRALAMLARRRREFDIVHDNQCLGYGLLGMPALGLPMLATVHHPVAIDRDLEVAHGAAERRTAILRWYRFVAMQRRVAGRLHRIITPSVAAKRAITRHLRVPGNRVDVVPVGVDHTVFHPDGERVPGRIVCTASADVPIKGLDTLIAAAQRLRDAGHRFELIVVGRPRVGNRTDLVSFRTGLSDVELADLLRSAEIACVPSRYEGFSLPAVEAMACGTPLVATTAGALPEVVGDAGLLVPHGDPDRLADALGRLLTVDFDRFPVGPGNRVLDVGAGTGRHAFAAYRLGADVVALDTDGTVLKDVRDMFAAMAAVGEAPAAASALAVHGDGTSMPFPDGAFDRVIAAEMLEHVPDDHAVLAEIGRVLAPGGRLAVTVPRWWPERICWALSAKYHEVQGGHVRIYRRHALRDRIADAGLVPGRTHHAHALHVPWWWLICVLGDDHRAAQAYHRFLCWDLTARPRSTRLADRLLNPVLGKSLVLYAQKPC